MNRQVEVTWRILRTIAHSLMVHARVLEAYINFVWMYTADHIFLVLPITDLINEDGNPTNPYKLATGMKPSISHLRVLFCPCDVRKDTPHIGTKVLNMHHQAQKGYRGILVGITQHQKKVSCLCTTQTKDCILIRCCFWWEFIYCVDVQVTIIWRRYVYVTGSVTHTLWYILKGTNWR